MRRESGFTLIELLCALTILALVLTFSLRILSGGSANAAAARDYGRALAVAQAHLAILQARDRLAAYEQSGEDGALLWRERVSRAEGPALAGAEALKILPWRLESSARLPDGRTVLLTSLRLERLP